jgi:acyl-ACP thioesterase
MMKPEWTTEHVIRSYDVDPSCAARLPVFCRFMQEAAYLHAEHLGVGHSHLSPVNMGWVLCRMRIEVDHLPRWGENVRLRTWPSGRDRLFYYRDFEISDGKGERVLRASTAWFVIDTERRERLLPDWWRTAEYPFGPGVFDSKPGRLKSCGCNGDRRIEVNYGDLDQNGHVSNIRYIEWILNRLPLEFHQSHAIWALEANYLAEAVCGHTVSIGESRVDGLTFDHGILSGNTELFRARTFWRTV